uniref:meiotic recombination protein REC114 n=1 Tax=Myxine glutinosa TaxID=7769 RepID=UPI00358F57BE
MPPEVPVRGALGALRPEAEGLNMPVLGRWPLFRYSRFEGLSGSAGHWQDYDGGGKSGILLLCLTHFGHIMVTHGNLALENTPVFEACMGVAAKRKEDCIYFTLKIAQGYSRVFCVWFAGESHEEVQKNSNDCINILRRHISIDESLNQPGIQPSQGANAVASLTSMPNMENGVSLAQLTQEVMRGPGLCHQAPLSRPQISALLQQCLMDPTFPAFVDQVEQEIMQLRTENE